MGWATRLAAIAAALRDEGVDAETAWEMAAAQLRGDAPPPRKEHSRKVKLVEHDGQPASVPDLARANGVRPQTAWARIRAGWSVADAVREPPQSVGSSRVDLQACKLEYSIVSPK